MPYAPARPCRTQGCPHLTDHPRGYCPEHLPQEYRREDANRLSSTERGYDALWNKRRHIYLIHNSLCMECLKEGRTEVATVVDHIIPHKGNKTLFWDESNWQSLCKMHHDQKTAKERCK
jgi:5-methylcytosine-specific restriction protein A